MQLTRLDRWLRERFVYETHVYTLRMPEDVPAGVITENLPEAPGRRFRHRFIVRSDKSVKQLIATLKEANQMFTTRIVDREAWYVSIIAPSGRSIIWWALWAGVSVGAVLCVIYLGRLAWQNPELRGNVMEAIEILKG